MNAYFYAVTGFVLIVLTACASNENSRLNDANSALVNYESSANGRATAVKYLLSQGDVIAIQVFDEPDLTMDTQIGASGSINYSYLGDIKVTGKSPTELEQHIAGLLRNGYLVNPSVNVSILEYRPFYINGEVRTPGSYPYEPGLTVDRAIALAGGLTDRASTRKIFITEEGGAAEDERRVTLSYSVRPGDIITLKEGFF